MPRKLPWEDSTATASSSNKSGGPSASKRQKKSDKKDKRTPLPKGNIEGRGESVASYVVPG
jgi:hypothetical protein